MCTRLAYALPYTSGNRVSLAHESRVRGPAWIEDDTVIGMKALVCKTHIGHGSVIEPAASMIGVTIVPGPYVKAGMTVTDQPTADALPVITETYSFRSPPKAEVHVNTSLADACGGRRAAVEHMEAPEHPKP